MSEYQPKLIYEDFNDSLHDLVQALGGYKKVGAMLWPERPVEEAAHALRHCLNKERREKLSPEQVRLLLQRGREIEFHGAMSFLAEQCGDDVRPIKPADEAADLIRRREQLHAELKQILDREERLFRGPLQVVGSK